MQSAFAYLFAKVARQQSFLLSGKPPRGIICGIVGFSDSNVVWGWGQGIQFIQRDPTVTGAVVNHFRVWVWCHLMTTTRCDDILTILMIDDFIIFGGEATVYQEWLRVVNRQLCRDIKTCKSIQVISYFLPHLWPIKLCLRSRNDTSTWHHIKW